MMRLNLFIVCLFFLSFNCFGQKTKSIQLVFSPTYLHKKLVLDSVNYLLPNSTDSVRFTNLKFYISNLVLLKNNKQKFAEKSSYHLVDVTNNKGLQFMLQIPAALAFDEIQFNFGIDSLTNNKGVLGKDLDPTKGMYWAWHSGYINFKLEGISKVCKTRNNVFQFHLGGFLNGFNACKKVALKTNADNNIVIDYNLYYFLNNIDIVNDNEIMTPSKKAVELSNIASKAFSIINKN